MEIEFAGSCKVDRAAELKQQLIAALETSAEVNVDLSRVKSCDLTLVQLLCAAQKTAKQSGKMVKILENTSEVFRNMVQESGLVHACQLCSVEMCVKEEIFHG